MNPTANEPKSHVKRRFEEVFPILVEEVLAYTPNLPEDAREWFHKNLTYNTSSSSLMQGHIVMDMVEGLNARPLSETQFVRAASLGWAIQLFLIHFDMSDDVTYNCSIRRGQPTWHRVDKVRDIAINDASLLQNSCMFLVQKHHRREAYYVDILELIQEAGFDAGIGRLNERTMAAPGRVDLSKFTKQKYRQIAIHKTSIPHFYLPVAAAMHLAGIKSPCSYSVALRICTQLGILKQYQDDYNALYSDGGSKTASLIQEGRASWNIITALELASPYQRQLLNEHYGQASGTSEEVVRTVFDDLSLPAVFAKYVATERAHISSLIEAMPDDFGMLKPEPFRNLLDLVCPST